MVLRSKSTSQAEPAPSHLSFTSHSYTYALHQSEPFQNHLHPLYLCLTFSLFILSILVTTHSLRKHLVSMKRSLCRCFSFVVQVFSRLDTTVSYECQFSLKLILFKKHMFFNVPNLFKFPTHFNFRITLRAYILAETSTQIPKQSHRHSDLTKYLTQLPPEAQLRPFSSHSYLPSLETGETKKKSFFIGIRTH